MHMTSESPPMPTPIETDFNAGRGPSTRYQGSKRKLLPWLHNVLGTLHFSTAADLMAGTGSVAYLLKAMGKRVVANDYLRSNFATLIAFIENPSTQLSEDDIEWLLGTHANVAYTSFVADTFHGYYFTKAENRWLDRIACNIAAFDGGGTTRTRYKKALAEHSLVQACLMKRPFNLFHRKNLYLRRANVDRSFGNKTTWDTPFPTLFERLALEGNEYVFSNGLRNRASNRDATHVPAKDVDFVYLDPPYFRARRDRAQSNYQLLYHFVDGLTRYSKWGELIDEEHPLKRFRPCSSSTDEIYTCPRKKLGKAYLAWLEDILSSWKNAQVAISHKHPGVPSSSSIRRLLLGTGRKVTVRTRRYWYALNHQNGEAKQNVELLFLAK